MPSPQWPTCRSRKRHAPPADVSRRREDEQSIASRTLFLPVKCRARSRANASCASISKSSAGRDLNLATSAPITLLSCLLTSAQSLASLAAENGRTFSAGSFFLRYLVLSAVRSGSCAMPGTGSRKKAKTCCRSASVLPRPCQNLLMRRGGLVLDELPFRQSGRPRGFRSALAQRLLRPHPRWRDRRIHRCAALSNAPAERHSRRADTTSQPPLVCPWNECAAEVR